MGQKAPVTHPHSNQSLQAVHRLHFDMYNQKTVVAIRPPKNCHLLEKHFSQ